MYTSSNLKRFLLDLREQKIIDEKLFVHLIDKIKISSKNSQKDEIILPSLDMFGLLYNETEIKHLYDSILKIESKIKETIKAWENKTLSKDETKAVLTQLVYNKEKLNHVYDGIQNLIKTKISRLKYLEQNSQMSLNDFFTTMIKNAETEEFSHLIIEIRAIWKKYSVEEIIEDQKKTKNHLMRDVEYDILDTLLLPLPEDKKIIFNLDDIIQPIENKIETKELFSNSISKSKKKIIIEETSLEPKSQDALCPWDLVGKVVYNLNKTPIGIFRPPIVVNRIIYLPIINEVSLDILNIKKRYKEVLKETDLDIKSDTTQEIKRKIANALNIPERLALYPSFFNQWLMTFGLDVSPVKPQLTKVQFIKTENIKNFTSNTPTVDESDLKQIEIPAWIPAPSKKTIDQIPIGKMIIGMAGSNFGSITAMMRNSPFGQSLVIERKVPPSYLLTTLLEGLGKRNFAELRFSIAKSLNIGEGEAFSSKSIWTINTRERLLISPHEITASYYSILPISAFTFGKVVCAKIGVYFHSIPETFRYLIGKPILQNDEKKGSIYGFSVQNGEIFILWTIKNPIDLIKEVGRKSSDQYVSRFKKRMSLALNVSYQESLLPSNMARYFLNFIWMTEEQTIEEAQTMVEDKFSLKKTSFIEIEEITKDGIKCSDILG